MPTPFTLPDTRGRRFAWRDAANHPLLLVFFKSACPSCVTAFPYLGRLHETYKKHGLLVWGVSQDTLDETLAFAADQDVTFPVLLDTTWEVSQSYAVEFTPTLALFDGDGQETYRTAGFRKDDLNTLAALVAGQTGSEPVVVAPANDGNPPFRPG